MLPSCAVMIYLATEAQSTPAHGRSIRRYYSLSGLTWPLSVSVSPVPRMLRLVCWAAVLTSSAPGLSQTGLTTHWPGLTLSMALASLSAGPPVASESRAQLVLTSSARATHYNLSHNPYLWRRGAISVLSLKYELNGLGYSCLPFNRITL